MNVNLIQCTELLEVTINPEVNTGSTVSFTNTGSISKIKDNPITGIEVYHSGIMPTSPISGLPVVNIARLLITMLNMYYAPNYSNVGAGQYMFRHPLVSLINVNSGTNPFVWDRQYFDNQLFLWDKCELFSNTPFNDEGTSYAFIFNVSYTVSNMIQSNQATPGTMKMLIDNVNKLTKKIGG